MEFSLYLIRTMSSTTEKIDTLRRLDLSYNNVCVDITRDCVCCVHFCHQLRRRGCVDLRAGPSVLCQAIGLLEKASQERPGTSNVLELCHLHLAHQGVLT
ncbi:hypothetical protein JZ751_011061 [Albula glossodonta]|uniref:Uncharacterized protein n=1 Tax=Albula glossodonta TaxID=121402 RepID=A0A8T2P433_9TELE|nr:hypothetical protein JZ751_011061 [Albula glossodonta]